MPAPDAHIRRLLDLYESDASYREAVDEMVAATGLGLTEQARPSAEGAPGSIEDIIVLARWMRARDASS